MTPPGPRCAAAGSPATFPSGAIRSPAAPPGGRAAGGHPPSAGKTTSSATSWNAPSAGSSSGATWPPATPNVPSTWTCFSRDRVAVGSVGGAGVVQHAAEHVVEEVARISCSLKRSALPEASISAHLASTLRYDSKGRGI